MLFKFRRKLDPLDLELLERALEGAFVSVKESNGLVDLDSDEALEATLRIELIEIARCNGVSDPASLREILLDLMSENDTKPGREKVLANGDLTH